MYKRQRSLSPKITSLVDCFDEMEASFAVVTETWLSDGKGLQEDIEHFEAGAGLGMLTRNRPANYRGVSHGGVALIYHLNRCSFKEVKLSNPGNFEVLATVGNFSGYSRKVVVLACYLPLNLKADQAAGALDFIRGAVVEMKRKFQDPYVVVSGDFNQWKVDETLEDFPDLSETDVGPTRGNRLIDRSFSNFARSVRECGTLPPLEADCAEEGAPQ